MTRKKQIFDKSAEYVEIYSRSIPIEFRDPINGHVEKAFIAGSEWADGTILKEVLKWLKEKTYTIYYRGGSEAFNINFESEEEMIQAFKERFSLS